MNESIIKYPRTRHLEGSRLQPGDEDLTAVPYAEIEKHYLVIEEKVDGANSGISFTKDQQLRLQSRGHFLTGGPREKHFALFKKWANCHRLRLWQMLGSRYVMYGEWVYAKHTIFYDQLPHYFLEFDLFDKEQKIFLSTIQRNNILDRTLIVPVPVIYSGKALAFSELKAMIGYSQYKSDNWQEYLIKTCQHHNLDQDRIIRETDVNHEMEGLYIKWEREDQLLGRYKFVRPSFLTSVFTSDSHWINRPILPNQLRKGVDLF
jgi:hypothetical protein